MKLKKRTLKRTIVISVLVVILLLAAYGVYVTAKAKEIAKCQSWRQPEQNICLHKATRTYHDFSVCMLSQEQDACAIQYAEFTKEYSYCEPLGANKETCMMTVAIAKKDINTCKTLGPLKAQCIFRVNESQ